MINDGIVIPRTDEPRERIITISTQEVSSTLQVNGVLVEGEVIDIQQANGENWVQVKYEGTPAQLDSENNVYTFYGQGRYRVAKPNTNTEVGVDMT